MSKSKHCLVSSADQEADEKLHDMELRLKQQQRILHRMYRRLEKEEGENRMKLNKFAEQEKIIRLMRRERQNLLVLRKLAPSASQGDDKAQMTASTTLAVNDMIAIYESQMELVEDCADALVEIGQCVDYLVKLMYKYRMTLQKGYGDLKTSDYYCRRQDVLEKRLEVWSVKFSRTMHTCEDIKHDINNWLKDRSKFHKRVKALKFMIGKAKENMNASVAKANSAYDKYDDYRMQDKLIKKRNSMECQIFVSDLKDSIRFLRNDRYLRDFIETKAKQRPFLEIDSERARRRIRSMLTSAKRLIPEYRRVFKLISEESGTPHIEHTLHMYLETEQTNFSTFRYVINLQDIIHVVAAEIKGLRDKISKQKKDRLKLEVGYSKRIKSYKQQNFDLNIEQANKTEKVNKTELHVKKLVKDVNELFQLAGCDEKASQQFLGNRHGLAVVNIIPFLKILEARVAILLRSQDALKRALITQKGASFGSTSENLYTPGHGANQFAKRRSFGGPFQPMVTIPNSFDTGENDDEDRQLSMRPLTYEEHWENCKTLASQATSFMKAFVGNESASGDEESVKSI